MVKENGSNENGFSISIEVVPPEGHDPEPLMAELESLHDLNVDSFSVATNPVAKPRMSSMVICSLIKEKTGRPATLHCTTRDHNRLSLQGLLWGARAIGIDTVLATSGDLVSMGEKQTTTNVKDVDVFGLISMAREAGLKTGVVLNQHPDNKVMGRIIERLEKKIESGAQFVVTQPVYDDISAIDLSVSLSHLTVPVIMGILPLRSHRHAEFLHNKVSGIYVPDEVRNEIKKARNPIVRGIENSKEMLNVAKSFFGGVCIMPPFDHYDILKYILGYSNN